MKIPKVAIGLILILSLISIIIGAAAPPNLPTKVVNPIPLPRIGVAYNSGPYTYEILKLILTLILANIPNTTFEV